MVEMKRICIVSALILMVLTALSGVVQTDDGKDVLAYWSFNVGEISKTPGANGELYADEGSGEIQCTFPINTSTIYTGTSTNLVVSGYDGGRALGFTKPSASGSYLFERDIEVKFSTKYYEDITVSYAVLFGSANTGDYIETTTHTIQYSYNGGVYETINDPITPELNNRWNLKVFNLHGITEVNDNSEVNIKISLSLSGNQARQTRIDNFLITGTPIYDFIPDRTDTIANTTITFEEGVADNITNTAMMPTLPPNAADGSESLALDLKGEGPWRIILENDKEYCAYNHGGAWVEVIKSEGNSESDGYFEIEIPSQRTGNELFVLFSDSQPTLPVELTAFKVFAYPGLAPKISWETASETALNGYYVLRGESPNLQSAQVISPLIHAQNSSLYMRYEFEDKTVVSEARYYYWLHILELNQIDSYAGPIALEYYTEESQTPEHTYAITGIRDIYPNPFNPSTNISFELADDSEVAFKMYNLRGEEVLGLESRPYPKGVHHIYIDSKTQAGRELPAGVYLLRMQVGASSYIRKITLLK